MSISIAHLNGRAATAEDLAPLAFAGYAHFTAMQVRDRAVRALDLHLDRLRTASDELFGRHLPDSQVREYLRTAIAAAPPDSSLTCVVTSRPGEFMPADPAGGLDVVVRITEAAQPPAGPLALDVVGHERYLPRIKHVGEVAKTHHLRRARARGFDDAAFEDRSGRLSEATIWNLAFWDGDSVIWPEADVLRGVTMQILARRLSARGVPQRSREIRRSDLTDRICAVVMNSWTPAVPITRLGGHRLANDPLITRLLHEAYDSEASTPV
ncbi:aminotransferase class IV family protein [Pseudonocardia sp. MH-G8]|uniref:aminotransferase class IV family protein n=1 Tax=Pseudonocardia sp. MH-G8 TaxID=1854588 RepID=UPI000BA051DD|nr:aminotransferase class IV family protein [Pseudonocardia sp. MH-G8]OZM78463.1 branched-chain amino acid aminotransferase [Pseudonocardia sp. MH-G8]